MRSIGTERLRDARHFPRRALAEHVHRDAAAPPLLETVHVAVGEVTALHLTVTKFHPPPADRHATILHPLKRPHPAHMSGASASGAAPLWAASGTGAAEPALLPLAFSLRPSAQHLSWEPHNRSVVERYLRHRETPRSLCRHVPCG